MIPSPRRPVRHALASPLGGRRLGPGASGRAQRLGWLVQVASASQRTKAAGQARPLPGRAGRVLVVGPVVRRRGAGTALLALVAALLRLGLAAGQAWPVSPLNRVGRVRFPRAAGQVSLPAARVRVRRSRAAAESLASGMNDGEVR